ncbi:ABC transporter ATP-binding protein [Paenibacillus humicus]|uniref:ABC transporter ATP-binding protein n=1 Tax=Paenibacillus humicus TaxID=412861 RepID=UPI003D2A1A06
MIIQAENLTRDFKIYDNSKGALSNLKEKVLNRGRTVRVVDNINFAINKGDFVGYLGPNGAGKSTTIKMLSGILVPTSGKILIDGKEPYKNRISHAKNIGVVFGQRTQLWWDLPLLESFMLLGRIYGLPKKKLKSKLDNLINALDLSSFLYTPVRELSLGQRMKGDLVASLIHDPQVLFLDEPTIGLDILAKEQIQQFLLQLNKQEKVTIILTTHNVDDIEKLCERVIFIDNGSIVFDGKSTQLAEKFGESRVLVIETDATYSNLELNGFKHSIEKHKISFELNSDNEISTILNALVGKISIKNVIIQESKIENVLKKLYLQNGKK